MGGVLERTWSCNCFAFSARLRWTRWSLRHFSCGFLCQGFVLTDEGGEEEGRCGRV